MKTLVVQDDVSVSKSLPSVIIYTQIFLVLNCDCRSFLEFSAKMVSVRVTIEDDDFI